MPYHGAFIDFMLTLTAGSNIAGVRWTHTTSHVATLQGRRRLDVQCRGARRQQGRRGSGGVQPAGHARPAPAESIHHGHLHRRALPLVVAAAREGHAPSKPNLQDL
eukprot:812400-Prymnesium_polylepis.2